MQISRETIMPIFISIFFFFTELSSQDSSKRKAVSHIEGDIIDNTTGKSVNSAVLQNAKLIYIRSETKVEYPGIFMPSGKYKTILPLGTYSRILTIPGYAVNSLSLKIETVDDKSGYEYNIYVSPNLKGYRIVLTWGNTERDLDSHTLTPSNEHIFYSNKQGDGIKLDVDDTDYLGPETTTITKQGAGLYKFYVHNFSGVNPLSASGAKVVFYIDNTIQATWDVPKSSLDNSYRYWNVFTFNTATNELKEVNQISKTPLFNV
jgi:hypothetical protein